MQWVEIAAAEGGEGDEAEVGGTGVEVTGQRGEFTCGHLTGRAVVKVSLSRLHLYSKIALEQGSPCNFHREKRNLRTYSGLFGLCKAINWVSGDSQPYSRFQ